MDKRNSTILEGVFTSLEAKNFGRRDFIHQAEHAMVLCQAGTEAP